eukprot:NODE_1332_length_2007_cov_115.957537_g1126_i0.p1 GENE.NODE_1332_length_2007_cov_115.957537_g1126_i0~~NODE_1332_length_2007_cov_115.957537_g1126_i0.p1  ORF type:complete len:592 (-),score=98.05 NODE_1332_length_2007_cov_115.957537_g1126_i0:230-1945(-)
MAGRGYGTSSLDGPTEWERRQRETTEYSRYYNSREVEPVRHDERYREDPRSYDRDLREVGTARPPRDAYPPQREWEVDAIRAPPPPEILRDPGKNTERDSRLPEPPRDQRDFTRDQRDPRLERRDPPPLDGREAALGPPPAVRDPYYEQQWRQLEADRKALAQEREALQYERIRVSRALAVTSNPTPDPLDRHDSREREAYVSNNAGRDYYGYNGDGQSERYRSPGRNSPLQDIHPEPATARPRNETPTGRPLDPGLDRRIPEPAYTRHEEALKHSIPLPAQDPLHGPGGPARPQRDYLDHAVNPPIASVKPGLDIDNFIPPQRGAIPPPRTRTAPAQHCTKKGHEQYICDIYCNVEGNLCCLLCLRRDEQHRIHKCTAIQPAPFSMRSSVVDWINNATIQKTELQTISAQLDSAIDKIHKQTESEIQKLDETVEDLKKKLDINRLQLIDQAKADTLAEVKRLSSIKAEISQCVTKISETMGEVQKLNSSSSVAELIHLKKFISLTSFQKDEQRLPIRKVGFKAHNAVHIDKLFDVGYHTEEMTLPASINPSNAVIDKEVIPTCVDFSVYT